MKTEDGRLFVIAGASRSGKTAWTVRQVKGARRVMVYDPEAQWSELRGFRKVTSRAELTKWAQQAGPMRVAFVPGVDLKGDFDFWCDAVLFAGRFRGPVAAVAEELADVTTPSKAPGAWGILLRRGLKRGITIFAISQRWAEADKTAIGNASAYVCFAMRGDDVAYMARKTRIPEAELAALQALEWIEVNAYGQRSGGGKLRF